MNCRKEKSPFYFTPLSRGESFTGLRGFIFDSKPQGDAALDAYARLFDAEYKKGRPILKECIK